MRSRSSEPRGADRASAGGAFEPAALLPLVALSGILAWWAWRDGGYFNVVLLPGAIMLFLCAAVLLLVAPWRARLRLSPAAWLAQWALVALAGWTLASALWSPTPDVAVTDGLRVLTYAVCFWLGLWLCNLLGERTHLALVPLTFAAGVAGVIAIAGLSSQAPRELLEVDGTLEFPLGYRNANVAFFAIAIFPAVTLAATPGFDARIRGLALGVAALAASLSALGQSRGSLPAIGVALFVYVIASPYRLRSIAWLALAALPALAILPALLDVYGAVADDGLARATDEVRAAARAAAAIAIAAAVAGALAARFEDRLPALRNRGWGNRPIAIVLVAAAAASVTAFGVAVGDPVDWLEQRAREFTRTGTPDAGEAATRFTLDVGSERADLWRVAIDDFTDEPLLGKGAGAFQYSYLRRREIDSQYARDAHSVELEHLGELGAPGLALFAAAIGAGCFAAARSRRAGPAAASLGAAALAATSYWLVHASIDWFWPYPAVTAPILVLLGAAAAPAVVAIERSRRSAWRVALLAAVAAIALVAVPPFMSDRYVDEAYVTWVDDPEAAYDALDDAAAINPLSDAPLLAEAAIARRRGDTGRAIASLRTAIERRPAEWVGHYLLAKLLEERRPELARRHARGALVRNPLSEQVKALARRLSGGRPGSAGRAEAPTRSRRKPGSGPAVLARAP